MESEQNDNMPSAKRLKLDNDPSPAQPTQKINVDCPIMSLPIDLLSKIIAFVPIAQWHALELVDKNFREATFHAWRDLRDVGLDDFLIKSKKLEGESNLERDIRAAASIIEKLNHRSPFLTSLHGVSLQTGIPELNSPIIVSMARFEHLESIDFGGGQRFTCPADMGCPIQDLNAFLATSRSRATLEELRVELCTVELTPERQPAMEIFVRRFSELISNDRGMREPLKLEIFSAKIFRCWKYNFGFMDLSRTTELNFGSSFIKPEQLTSMINGAPNLELLNFAFFHCKNGDNYNCGGNGLRKNLDLLRAIASREKLQELEFVSHDRIQNVTYHQNCMQFEPEFRDMLKAIGRRGIFEKLTFYHHFVSPKFDMNGLIATISGHFPQLQTICIPIDDCNAQDLKTIVKMEYLEEIDFLYRGENQKFYEISDGFFAQLGNHKRLKRVSLGGFARENEHPLSELAKLSTLEEVRIRRVDKVRKEDFVTWSMGHVANLESLALSGIGVVDKDAEVGLISLIRKTPRLCILQIEGMITDRLLDAIAESCPKLRSLGVASRKDEISVGALQNVVNRCPELKNFGGVKYDIRKQLTFPKYWKISNACANPWSTDGDDDNDVYYNDGDRFEEQD